MSPERILYCHCAYANVVPPQVKAEVLEGLARSGQAFDAVADLCEMSARRDPALARLAAGEGTLKIAACFPRAVRWLFAAAGAALPAEEGRVQICNMRVDKSPEVLSQLVGDPEESSAGGAVASRGGEGRKPLERPIDRPAADRLDEEDVA